MNNYIYKINSKNLLYSIRKYIQWAAPLPGLPELTGAPLFSAGPNLKEWLREQFCDHPLEHCEDTRLHDAAYVGDLQTLRNLLQEESYRR